MSIGTVRATKRIRLPVRVVAGRILLASGKPLPALADGAEAELVLDEEHLEDGDLRERLKHEHTIDLLPPGSAVLLTVGMRAVPPSERAKLFRFDEERGERKVILWEYRMWPAESRPHGGSEMAFVEARLHEPLVLALQGAGKASLRGGKCHVPAIGRDATSVNHACTLASEHFEPHRTSHTGNAFEKVRYEHTDGTWRLLNALREEHQDAYYDLLFHRSSPLPTAQATFNFD